MPDICVIHQYRAFMQKSITLENSGFNIPNLYKEDVKSLLQKNLEIYTCDAIWLLKNLISIPSFSKEEDKTAEFIYSYLHSLGLDPKRKGNNVWATSIISEDLPTILLNSHHDTVKPTSTWRTNPFEPTFQKGKLTGLGSNDAGASVVSQLMAYRILCQVTDRPYNLIYSATAEEESSTPGGIESILKELGPVDLALVGEPTQMQMAIAEKGLGVLECTVYGVTGHAARNEGINALYRALDDINKIREIKFPKVSSLLGEVKLTVTAIKAGSQHNVIPDICTFLVDVRSNELYTHDEIIEIIKGHTQHTEIAVALSNQKTSIISEMHPVVQRALDLGLIYFGSSTTSDQMVIPYPSVKIGPGDSARSHAANEFIYIHEIEEAIKTYSLLLNKLTI